jgi:hypothetical protein
MLGSNHIPADLGILYMDTARKRKPLETRATTPRLSHGE